MSEKVTITLDVEQLSFDEMIDIQEGNLRKAKSILVKFVTDEKGKPIGEDAAAEAVGKLSIVQMRDVFAEFGRQVSAAMSESLPKARGPK